MVLQIVRASIKPERRDHWLEVIRLNAARTRAEAGCDSYQVAQDLEHPDDYVIVEQWASMEAVHEHFRNQFGWLMSTLGDVFTVPPTATFHDVTSSATLGEVLAAAGASPAPR